MQETKTPVEKCLAPFYHFLHKPASGGVLLFLFTVIALVWANTPLAPSYFALWETRVSLAAGPLSLSKPLILWVNDGLMAVFFFIVGLEIKREIVAGELKSPRKAALPAMAALGGMIVPALLYSFLNMGEEGSSGWGIPMATDIAFSLGVLQLLGKRVPLSLKVFLTAFAIVDDLGAVLVIAIFYTAKIELPALAVAAIFLATAILLNVAGVRRPLVYAIVGVALWIAILKSGVHATVAGVLLAMTIPARTRVAEEQFVEGGRKLLEDFARAGTSGTGLGMSADRRTIMEDLHALAEKAETPLQRLEHSLHPWVAFIILPLFALANAGVRIGQTGGESLAHPISLGIVLGLVAGKCIGVTLFSLAAVKLNLASLPLGVDWRHIVGVAFLGGIGFTMSLFVATLAFDNSDLLDIAKIGILTGSTISAAVGVVILMFPAGKDR